MRRDTRVKPVFTQSSRRAQRHGVQHEEPKRGRCRFEGSVPWLIILLFVLGGSALGETPPANSAFPSPLTNRAPKELSSLERRVKPILADLNLNDAAKSAHVRQALVQHLAALNTWHQANDANLKNLWTQFNLARVEQNQIKADTAQDDIERVYAALKPQRTAFLQQLAEVLSPSQVDRVLDSLTANKVHVIFNNYGEVFHDLKEDQKEFVMRNLKAAREEAIVAGSMQEKSEVFKKYRIKIDAYLGTQGYDVKQSYRDFNEKLKAERAAKRGGAAATEDAE